MHGKPFYFTVPQIAELKNISPHAYPRGSYEQHPEVIRTYVSSRLHIGFDPINLNFTCFACYCSCVM